MKVHRRWRVAGVAAGGGAKNFYSGLFYSVFVSILCSLGLQAWHLAI